MPAYLINLTTHRATQPSNLITISKKNVDLLSEKPTTMISKKCKYAIKAILYIARNQQREEAVYAAEIAEREGIPLKFLESILRDLRNNGILLSKRGRGGGYKLLKKAEEISFTEIIRIMDGPIAMLPCVSLHYYVRCDECAIEENCPIRTVFLQVRDATLGILSGATVDQLTKRQ